MRYVSFLKNGATHVGVREGQQLRVLGAFTMEQLLRDGVDLNAFALERHSGEMIDVDAITFLPPLSRPSLHSGYVFTGEGLIHHTYG